MCPRVRYAKASCVLEAVAGTSQHRLAPMESGLSTVQWPFALYDATTTSAARRARFASARAAPPPHRQRAQWRSRARHAKAGCVLKAAAGTAHHGLAPMEKDASPVSWPCVGCKLTTTSAAWRARVAGARAAPRLERQREQWRARVRATRKPAVCWRPQLARRTTVLRRWREASRRCSGPV